MIDSHNTEQLKSAIITVLNDPTLQAELRQKGLQQAAKFNWKDSAEKLISVFEMVEKDG